MNPGVHAVLRGVCEFARRSCNVDAFFTAIRAGSGAQSGTRRTTRTAVLPALCLGRRGSGLYPTNLPLVFNNLQNCLVRPVEPRGCHSYSFDYSFDRKRTEGPPTLAFSVGDLLLLRQAVAGQILMRNRWRQAHQ